MTNGPRRFAIMRSARVDRFKGAVDRMAGRVLEFFGRMTGKRSASAKGKAARGRGTFRATRGHLKRRSG
jgi:uncharacterized protein YjbJ (UPF0337 family)